MSNTYTIKMTETQFTAWLAMVGINVAIRAADHAADEAPPARKRTSKVSIAILGALESGPKTVKQLKEALEAADLSAGSLSTGVMVLQQSNEIERLGDGQYALKMAKAAE